MGFRFHRSIKLLPGIRLNFGKRGISTSIGVRGAHVTFGKTGTRTTVGLPGSGLSQRTSRGGTGALEALEIGIPERLSAKSAHPRSPPARHYGSARSKICFNDPKF